MARTKARRWIGIDGEGVGRRPHRYVMLATSDGDVIERRAGLRTKECLELLLSLGTRDARVCGYYLAYDWTMILRDLPDAAIYILLRPELRTDEDGGDFRRVKWRGYHLHFLGGAMWISHPRTKRRVTIWDIGKYFQCKFVDALKKWDLAPDVRDHIAAMKDRRNAFRWSERKKILQYCQAECAALAELAAQLERAHTDANLAPRAWHGPGSTASVLLRRHEIHEKRGNHPPAVEEAAALAYFGGRAEISTQGRITRPVYGYDISSAYPYHSTTLPCLEHGRWQEVTRERDLDKANVAQAIVFGTIEASKGDWGPLPIRKQDGSIIFPLCNASGAWWLSEWRAARKWPGLKFDRALVLIKQCVCKPFAFVAELFAHRLIVGKDSGEGIAIKLALNSLYGKLAQRLHGKFTSRLWAGMITAGTRAQVLDLIARHKRQSSVLMVATDGVFSIEHFQMPKQVTLGGWECTHYDRGITLARPGFYWEPGGKIKARGFGKNVLESERVREQLEASIEAGAETIALPDRTMFGGAKMMIRSDRSGQLSRKGMYGQWYPMPSQLSLRPAPKRNSDWSPPRPTKLLISVPFGAENDTPSEAKMRILEAFHELSL